MNLPGTLDGEPNRLLFFWCTKDATRTSDKRAMVSVPFDVSKLYFVRIIVIIPNGRKRIVDLIIIAKKSKRKT